MNELTPDAHPLEPRRYTFAGFRVDAVTRNLTLPDGQDMALSARVFDLLLQFVQHPGELLAKDRLLTALWPGRVVEENNLNQAVSALRRALGQHAGGRELIRTEPGRGYRFVGEVCTPPPAPSAEADITPTGTNNQAAHRLYLQGRHHMDKAAASEIHSAVTLYMQAIELDPVYAVAWAALAEAHRRLPLVGDTPPLDSFPLASAAARKALQIDPDLPLAHANLGWVAFWHEWDWAAAEAHFRHAIAAAPEVAEAHLGLAHLLTNLGRFEDAMAPARRAMELDPFSPIIATITASFLGAAGRIDEARQRLDAVIADHPRVWVAALHRAELALAQDNLDAALDDLLHAQADSHGAIQVLGPLGYSLARAGRRDHAQALLADLRAPGHAFVPPSSRAMILAGLGERDAALAELEGALAVRDVRLTFLKRDTAWQSLRGDARFAALMQAVGLA